MPASRLLPTEEAADLIALVREIATEELAPRAAEAEADRDVPARGVPHCSAGPACSGCPTPRSTAAAASPTRSTSRSLEEIAAVWAERRRRRLACTRCPASAS